MITRAIGLFAVVLLAGCVAPPEWRSDFDDAKQEQRRKNDRNIEHNQHHPKKLPISIGLCCLRHNLGENTIEEIDARNQ